MSGNIFWPAILLLSCLLLTSNTLCLRYTYTCRTSISWADNEKHEFDVLEHVLWHIATYTANMQKKKKKNQYLSPPRLLDWYLLMSG